MELVRLQKSDGSWADLELAWKNECEQFSEEFESYASSALQTLRDECDEDTIDQDSGVFGLVDDSGRRHAACFLNRAQLPGYSGRVLRVRHLLLSPHYDFSDLGIEDYTAVLTQFFVELVRCSNEVLRSDHIKIHYRSPYDRTFFAAFAPYMRDVGTFSLVESKGMWLYLTKS